MRAEDLNERIEKSESDFKNNRFKSTSELLAKYEWMELNVVWSNFAETQLDEIFEYYREKASLSIANKLVRELILESEQ